MPLVLLLPYGKTENLIVVAVVVTVVAECFHRREKTQHRRSAHERKMSEKHASAATEICALPASPLLLSFTLSVTVFMASPFLVYVFLNP